jgi:hypothetical protein
VNGTAATPASAGGASSTIFVGNLPWSATEDDIAGLFADCGEVKGVRIGECTRGASSTPGIVDGASTSLLCSWLVLVSCTHAWSSSAAIGC